MSLLSLASGRVLGNPSLPGRAGLLGNSAEMRAARSTAATRCQKRASSICLPAEKHTSAVNSIHRDVKTVSTLINDCLIGTLIEPSP